MGILLSGHGQITDTALFVNFGIPYTTRFWTIKTIAVTVSLAAAVTFVTHTLFYGAWTKRFGRPWLVSRMQTMWEEDALDADSEPAMQTGPEPSLPGWISVSQSTSGGGELNNLSAVDSVG